MVFLAPAFLIGFLALVVPVVIHLWSKNSQNSKPFGSIRFLAESETKTMRSIMPSQWLLLASRLLLLGLLVLIMAETFWKGDESKTDTIYLVDTIYEGTPLLKAIEDTLSNESEMRWLVGGFPPTSEVVQEKIGDYWSLLSNPPQAAKQIVVVSPLLMNNFNSVRKAFPVNFTWMKLPISSGEVEVTSYKKGEDSFSVEGMLDEWSTTFRLTKVTDAEPLQLSYSLRVDEEYKSYGELFEAAISAMNSLSPLTIVQSSDPQNADWLIWLSNANPPNRGNIVLIDEGSIEKWKKVTNDVIQISSDWDTEDAIKLDLPQKLLVAFTEDLVDVRDVEKRTMDPKSFTYQAGEIGEEKNTLQSGLSALWLGLLALLALERWLAFRSEKS